MFYHIQCVVCVDGYVVHVSTHSQMAGEEQPNWVEKRKEVEMTTEEMGRGSCGVEAKCLQQVTISKYIFCQLNREISIATELATKLYHPSLLLFICAIRGKELVILTKLMPTKELEKNRELSREQVISIGQDMSFGLTYMHQLRPHPIIYHEISSGNILLEPLSNGLRAKIPDYSSDTHHSPVVLLPK